MTTNKIAERRAQLVRMNAWLCRAFRIEQPKEPPPYEPEPLWERPDDGSEPEVERIRRLDWWTG